MKRVYMTFDNKREACKFMSSNADSISKVPDIKLVRGKWFYIVEVWTWVN